MMANAANQHFTENWLAKTLTTLETRGLLGSLSGGAAVLLASATDYGGSAPTEGAEGMRNALTGMLRTQFLFDLVFNGAMTDVSAGLKRFSAFLFASV